jgi:hypothetical protein
MTCGKELAMNISEDCDHTTIERVFWLLLVSITSTVAVFLVAAALFLGLRFLLVVVP